jgi:hypothetical protein
MPRRGSALLTLGLVMSTWTVVRVNIGNERGTEYDKPRMRLAQVADLERANQPSDAAATHATAQRPWSKNTFQGAGLAQIRKPAAADRQIARNSDRSGLSSDSHVITIASAAPVRRDQTVQRPKVLAAVVQLLPLPLPPIVLGEVAPWREIAPSRKLTGSFWLLARRSSPIGSQLGAGELGAAQAGIRGRLPLRDLTDRINLGVSMRTTAPLNGQGRELAIGFGLKQAGKIPIELILERRLALSKGGRDRASLLAAGGVSDVPMLAGFRLEAYAQSGVVGFHHPNLFFGGQVSARHAVSRGRAYSLELGGGSWFDAQSHISRLDFGPEVILRTRIDNDPIRIAAQWRLRAAGHARPASGPVLIVAGDF